MTKDLDIVIHPEDVEQALERLRAAGFVFASKLAVLGSLWMTPDEIEVDVIEGREAWIDEALADPATDPAGYPVLGLPYLVMMKMASSRGVDLGDLTRMLGLASEAQLAAVRAAVARYLPEDAEDLETLVFLGRREMQFPAE
jgi:hypothetical protein